MSPRAGAPIGATRILATALSVAVLLSLAPALARAGDCRTIDDNLIRLACYDRDAGRSPRVDPPPAAPGNGWHATASGAAPPGDAQLRGDQDAELHTASDGSSPMSRVWELDAERKRGTFRLLPHQANYLLPIRASTRPNRSPSSPAAGHDLPITLPLDATEAKLQFSFKTKVWENIMGDNGDLWLAYTQQSHWQAYNGAVSSPFRESNYEPEAIFSLRTDADVFGWNWRLLNLGFVHQSNGQPLPISRSWNRVYAQFGLERGNFSLLLRPWLRLPEKTGSDDNPDIRDYLGSGDVRLSYLRGGHALSALGRYSFSGKRGYLQLDWAYPISGALKGYVQISSGYGESLIDYNHKQTTLGLGVVFAPWE